MQPKSIHNPAQIENAQSQNPFPTSGDNFTTIANLDEITDLMGLLQSIDFLEDCQAAFSEFKQEKDRTGTP